MRNQRIIIELLVLFTLSFQGMYSQDQPAQGEFRNRAEILKSRFDQLYDMPPSPQRDSLNKLIISEFREVLSQWTSFYYPWEELDMIGKVASDDARIKVFTWHLPFDNGEYRYFGLIQTVPEGKRNDRSVKVYTLEQKTGEYDDLETAEVTTDKWPGMLYYDMVRFSFRKDNYYVLMGYAFGGPMSQKKIIDVIRLNKKGIPSFGGKFHREEKQTQRVVFQYSAQVVMQITHDKRLKMLVFDHLQPFEPLLRGDYRFYAPDGSYDAYEFVKGDFFFREDVDARNRNTSSGSGE